MTMKHTRLALALGMSVAIAACGTNRDGRDDGTATTDTAGGTVATTPATGGAGTGSMEATGDTPRSDGDIMAMIAHGNDAEVSSGRLAQARASNAQVKAFARQMVTEHTAMQKEGQAIGKSLAMEGTGTPASHDTMAMKQDDLASLEGKSGADFDRAYMDMQVQAHERTLAELQQYETMARNAELKQMITKAIPAVQGHLQKARQLRQQLGS